MTNLVFQADPQLLKGIFIGLVLGGCFGVLLGGAVTSRGRSPSRRSGPPPLPVPVSYNRLLLDVACLIGLAGMFTFFGVAYYVQTHPNKEKVIQTVPFPVRLEWRAIP